ncbi:PadR family transcriptional regulator [candidate division WOR-3 bacterium]|nr:PadR family transcriptional regulator [candidate division WOR-3 bacterium]
MKRKFCSGFGFRANNVLYAAVLALLKKKSTYGYEIVEELSNLGISTQYLPYGLIYRLLRDMEANGLVTSQWHNEETGPSKRIYKITSEGKKYIAAWLESAKENLNLMEKIIHYIEKSLN